MDYQILVEQFDIRKGERIWLSSDIIGFALEFRKEKKKLDQNALIDAFIEAVGEEGTILIPTFNFDFSNNGYYDYKKSKGTTGALGNTALKRDDFKRTKHPLHSFAVWGRDKELLCSMENNNSFGTDSPFGYCVQRHVRQIVLGTDYKHALTFMHYAESVCNAPYRYMKTFHGTYVTEDGVEEIRDYIYPVRQLDIHPEECSNNIGQVFEESGLAVRTTVCGIDSLSFDLAEVFPVLIDDIIHNMARGIYEFDIPREQIFVYDK